MGEKTKFGKGVQLGYGGLGIVIHGKSVIGDNVVIGTGEQSVERVKKSTYLLLARTV
ncbi:MAG: hypothetical protein IE889_08080 [Campylobacterales bacterium]|nr:hypothetical protein [Campylobacterales bacterium]